MNYEDYYRVPLEKLKKICNYEDELSFCKTSFDVPLIGTIVDQERAVTSMEFGLKMDVDGYNIFVVGPAGTGKNEYTGEVVSRVAAGRKVPNDWCYLQNFSTRDKPLAVSLPSGRGLEFQKDMEKLIAELRTTIRKAFESTDYELKKDRIFTAYQMKMEELVQIIGQKALAEGFSVQPVEMKFVFIPLHEGKPFQPEDYSNLTDEERRKLNEKRYSLVKNLDKILVEGQISEKIMTAKIYELARDTAFFAATPLIQQLKEKYRDIPKIIEYLDMVLNDVAERNSIFNKPEPLSGRTTSFQKQKENESSVKGIVKTDELNYIAGQEEENPFNRYRINLFVNNEKQMGAPVVVEANPYYYNLFGKIEYKSQILVMNTDFTMVKPGAIHFANGGYLILQAKDVLTDPFVWNTLKKMLKYRQAVVENIGEQYRTVPTVTLKPEPIPLNIKVILIGSPIYYLILSSDEDFKELFKVKVDFDYEMPRNPGNLHKYVSFISSICHKEGLKHFSQSGLAGIIEYGSRVAGDQNKLSTRFDDVKEIVYEAIIWAKAEDSEYVDMSHVKKAITERKYRFNKLEEKIQEEILHKKIIIDTDGAAVGQINGLFIMQMAGYSFGLPARITAITHIGGKGVINIERETEMSGNIHSKGVFTLAGYLGGKLAQKKPLGFTAQVTFEQNYEGVEGDSASSAELYAIISSLAGIEMKQSIAVTGSVDQRGEIQPIGGVNEKIEGFFDICNAKGLTGEQGVIIPSRNIDNLMLKDEVLDAVKNELFRIYAINNIEEGIELLSGLPAGEIGDDGNYSQGSVFYYVNKKLKGYHRALQEGHGNLI
ncbi:Lon protease family protein [Acetobacterium bakii]|uniref:endopeptidase La n=1 Tax=Acetobacterium bakii TaxID=52689 RepID=A0A0L6TWV8_9FIRM|nr:ATP-binding protein [Acetobacterium bakii]KNZ40756.1 ATP-dependent protease [Acetobacterium bakii]